MFHLTWVRLLYGPYVELALAKKPQLAFPSALLGSQLQDFGLKSLFPGNSLFFHLSDLHGVKMWNIIMWCAIFCTINLSLTPNWSNTSCFIQIHAYLALPVYYVAQLDYLRHGFKQISTELLGCNVLLDDLSEEQVLNCWSALQQLTCTCCLTSAKAASSCRLTAWHSDERWSSCRLL